MKRYLFMLMASFFLLTGCSGSRYETVEMESVLTPTKEVNLAEWGKAEAPAKERAGGEPALAAETKEGQPAAAAFMAEDGALLAETAEATAEEAAEGAETGNSGKAAKGAETRNSGKAAEGTEAGNEGEIQEETEGEAREEIIEETAYTNGHKVAVDAGRQAKANSEKEPIGPSSDTMKAKMTEGSTGTVTGVKEYELTLTIAKKLEAELIARGYEVVMVRDSNDVNLSNAERAAIANESGAEIFVRLHGNFMENSGVYGALSMCMTAQNPYNAELHTKSYALAKRIVDQICAQTGTKNRGVQEVDNSGALNWSQIPVADVAMGFLSNPDEDRWLQDDSYQAKIVVGIANAIDAYFAAGN